MPQIIIRLRGFAAFIAVAGACVLLSSCGGSKDTTSVKAGPPASLTIISGEAQSGVVGQELSQPVVVKVVDANGNAVSGQVVNFHLTAGGGSVFAGPASTNSDGVAQERRSTLAMRASQREPAPWLRVIPSLSTVNCT